MVLVAPEGIRPPEGEGYIMDFFQVMAPQHFAATMNNPAEVPEIAQLYGGQGPEAFELWEDARAQTARIAWQPFMFNPSLPHLLGVAARIADHADLGPRGSRGAARRGACVSSIDQGLDAQDFRQMRASARSRKKRTVRC